MKWELATNYDPKSIEEQILDYWSKNNIRKKVLEKAWKEREGKPIFSFLEGPPTTNGYMHVGHARGRIYKDVMIRYHIVKGYRVWAQGGWDTQGLPVELEIEKKFNVKSKKEIEERIGVEKFIEECKKSVDHYINEWVKDNERLAVWMDYENAYQTRIPRYLETVWLFIKKAHEKGLLYKSYNVVPRCPRCGTALSNHEVSLGSEVVKDPSLYFKVKDKDEDIYYAVWTTTPWTIIANKALAVNPDATYVLAEIKGEKLVVAEELLGSLAEKLGENNPRIIKRIKGKELEGRRYIHPLGDEVPRNKKCEPPECTIVLADYVTVTDGTGIVHTAPAHGPEDFETAKKYNLPIWTPLKENGYFGDEAGIFKDLWFKKANQKVIEALKEKGLLLTVEELEHEYPHCWRCGTPLMYYPTSQWFIRTTKIVPQMREILKKVTFRPSWGYNRMDSWVESSRDWCISRERYWGTPLPVWACPKCHHIEVIGSIKELEERSGGKIKDPHKPYIDRVTIKCPKCGTPMRREPFVMDVWADSGVAHTAALRQLRKEKIHPILYPYSFALEPPEQVRGWFYTLLITSTVLHEKNPYKTLGMHGLILDAEGQKMSKSKGNFVLGRQAMEKHGADQLRLFMSYRNSPWQDIRYIDKEIREIGGKLRVIYNMAKFLISYAELDQWKTTNIENDLKKTQDIDKWVLTRTQQVIKEVEKALEDFDLHQASRTLYDFLVEDVSHIYIVAIRPRVWIEKDVPEKRSAYAILFTIFKHTLPLMAVFTPFFAEYIYHVLYEKLGDMPKETVMLEEITDIPERLQDKEALDNITRLLIAHQIITSYRGEKNIKRRMPLKHIHIQWNIELTKKKEEEYKKLLSILSNVKQVTFSTQPPGVYKEVLESPNKEVKVYIIEEIDEEVLMEGLAKEVIRRIQILRKEQNLNYNDKIKVQVSTKSSRLVKAIEKHMEYIMNETRAIKIESREHIEGKTYKIEDEEIKIQIEKS